MYDKRSASYHCCVSQKQGVAGTEDGFLPTDFSLEPVGADREENKEEAFHSGVHIDWVAMMAQMSCENV